MMEAVLFDAGISLLSDRNLSLRDALERMELYRHRFIGRPVFVALSNDTRLITLVSDHDGGVRLAVMLYDRQFECDSLSMVYRETDSRWFDGDDLDSRRWSVVQFRGYFRDPGWEP